MLTRTHWTPQDVLKEVYKMTEVQYSYACFLGSRYSGCSITSDNPREIDDWKNEMIARFGAIARFVLESRRYME